MSLFKKDGMHVTRERDYFYFQSVWFNQIYLELLTKLYKDPDNIITNRKGDVTRELVNCSFQLDNPMNCFATIRKMSMEYLDGEMAFYLSGSPFLCDIIGHSTFWKRVTDDGRSVNSNYGKLLMYDRNENNYTQFEYAKDMLITNRDTKKAVMTIYSKENARPSNDNPCTMYLHFMIRKDNQLDLFVKMRSSDIWYGLPYDVPFFSWVQTKMVYELNSRLLPGDSPVTLGIYNHQAGSLHYYDRNEEDIKGVLSDETIKFEDQDELFHNHILFHLNKVEVR